MNAIFVQLGFIEIFIPFVYLKIFIQLFRKVVKKVKKVVVRVGLEPTTSTLIRSPLSPTELPYLNFGTPPRIRTGTERILSSLPLPVGIVGHWRSLEDSNPRHHG